MRVRGAGGSLAALDWRSLGVPEWLADRLERLQLPFPTGWRPSTAMGGACWRGYSHVEACSMVDSMWLLRAAGWIVICLCDDTAVAQRTPICLYNMCMLMLQPSTILSYPL